MRHRSILSIYSGAFVLKPFKVKWNKGVVNHQAIKAAFEPPCFIFESHELLNRFDRFGFLR